MAAYPNSFYSCCWAMEICSGYRGHSHLIITTPLLHHWRFCFLCSCLFLVSKWNGVSTSWPTQGTFACSCVFVIAYGDELFCSRIRFALLWAFEMRGSKRQQELVSIWSNSYRKLKRLLLLIWFLILYTWYTFLLFCLKPHTSTRWKSWHLYTLLEFWAREALSGL